MRFAAARHYAKFDVLYHAGTEAFCQVAQDVGSEGEQLPLPELSHYVADQMPSAASSPTSNGHASTSGKLSGADFCPSCGMGTFIRSEGCRKCLSCGYSEC